MLSLWWFQPVSWALGIVDYSFVLLNAILGNSRPKFFSGGWGKLEPMYEAQDMLLEALTNSNDTDVLRLTDEEIEWDETIQEESQITIQRGCFTSPLAHLLPEESHPCRFLVVKPRNQRDKTSNEVYVIMLPATGEMGKSTRLAMARHLAATHGYASLIITAPFYGSRKPPQQKLFCMNTVSDLLLQSQSIIQETAMLACYLLRKSASTKVCITGFSWGAAMSSCVSAVALLGTNNNNDGKRLACAPYVGCASPVLMADGVLQGSIDWDALASNKGASESPQKTLYDELNKTQLTTLTGPLQQATKSRKSLGAVCVACMGHDHFIRRHYVQDFLEQLKTVMKGEPKSVSVSWFPGGHIFAALMRPLLHRRLVIEAVEALEKVE